MDAQAPAALGGRITTWLILALILVITAAGSPALAFQTFNRIKTGGVGCMDGIGQGAVGPEEPEIGGELHVSSPGRVNWALRA